jgi:hypothetical protein
MTMFPAIRRTIGRSTLLLVPALLFACSADRGNGTADASPAQGGAEPAAQTAPASQIPTGHFAGTVTETMDAASYTYVRLEKNGESVWAAGPQTEVAVGDELLIELVMPMPGFESPALKRKFDVLYFVGAFGNPADAGAPGAGAAVGMTGAAADKSAAADPHAGVPGMGGKDVATDPHAGMPGMGGDMANPHAGVPGFEAGAGAAAVAAIEKPEGGHRIADVWAKRDGLVGKEVLLRGEVVKYNDQILGVNWIHIQDGSGDPAAGTHDITVTSQDRASVGDIVTVRGTLAKDKDFGSGYRYELLVEEASVSGE